MTSPTTTQTTSHTTADASHRVPVPPEHRYTAEDIRRFDDSTRVLRLTAVHEVARRVLELARGCAPKPVDGAAKAWLEELRADLRATQASLEGGRAAQREQHRFFCDALMLHRACPRQTCRKAQSCRGNTIACFQRARVPEPVLDFVAHDILKASVPSLALVARTKAEQRAAYEGWIGGIEARR